VTFASAIEPKKKQRRPSQDTDGDALSSRGGALSRKGLPRFLRSSLVGQRASCEKSDDATSPKEDGAERQEEPDTLNAGRTPDADAVEPQKETVTDRTEPIDSRASAAALSRLARPIVRTVASLPAVAPVPKAARALAPSLSPSKPSIACPEPPGPNGRAPATPALAATALAGGSPEVVPAKKKTVSETADKAIAKTAESAAPKPSRKPAAEPKSAGGEKTPVEPAAALAAPVGAVSVSDLEASRHGAAGGGHGRRSFCCHRRKVRRSQRRGDRW
jgi:hypothetical protein